MKKLFKSDVCGFINSTWILFKGEKSKVPAFEKKKKKLQKRKCASLRFPNALLVITRFSTFRYNTVSLLFGCSTPSPIACSSSEIADFTCNI